MFACLGRLPAAGGVYHSTGRVAYCRTYGSSLDHPSRGHASCVHASPGYGVNSRPAGHTNQRIHFHAGVDLVCIA
jgi:hypothetical protein